MLHSAALAELDAEVKKIQRLLQQARGLRIQTPPVLLGLAWALVGLMGLLQRFPPIVETLLTVGFWAGFIGLFVRGFRRHPAPTLADARASLALSCALEPGAFDILDDRPVAMGEQGLALWRAARTKAVNAALESKPNQRKRIVNPADPWRLRAIVPIMVIGGAVLLSPIGEDRVIRAFVPNPGPLLGDARVSVQAWATPAAYVNAAPVSLTEEAGVVFTPPSVTVTVRVQGPVGAPEVVFDPDIGPTQRLRMTQAADGAFEAELALPGRGWLRVNRFHTVAQWRLSPAVDANPEVAFTAPPEPGDGEDLVIAWSASDDYGVRAIALSVRPVDPPAGLVGAADHVTVIEGPAGDPLTSIGETEVDLAEHPYAGMAVEVRLLARDALGQEGLSEPVRLTMPEKLFLQPLALAALEIRRTILWERRPYAPARAARGGPVRLPPSHDGLLGIEPLVFESDDQFPTLERSPAAIRRAARLLDAVTMAPQDGTFSDFAVFAGLRYARALLANAAEIEDTDAAAAVLWRVALRAEYGSSTDAGEALARAQAALAEALGRGDSADRIRRLMEALEEATQNYLDSLVAEALQRESPDQANAREDAEDMAEVSEGDVDDILEEVQRLAEEGRTAEAQALLQALTDMLQNLEVRLADGPGANPNGEGTQGGEGEAAQGFNEAMREQRALQDDTQAEGESQGEGGGENQGEGGEALAERQRDLRQSLAEARRQAGEAGATDNTSLQAADEAMDRAAESLQRGAFDEAAAAQAEALENLMSGAEQANREMREEREARGGAEGQSGQTDPLGRNAPNAGGQPDGEDGAPLPAEAERARARQILDELRRRSEDQSRTQEERDYLRRLLDRFEGS